MPIIESSYSPGWLYHRHLSTIYMGRLRRIPAPPYKRERIVYDTDDFLDLDWINSGSKSLYIITHGLEGSSNSHGVRSIASYFSKLGHDVLALNLRGCSGEANRKVASYNSGSSDQLSFIIDYAIKNRNYDSIYLIGISVGGNITLKYLGESGSNLDSKIRAAVAISVPCDLSGSSDALEKLQNRLYLMDFIISLKKKVIEKADLMQGLIDLERIKNCKTFKDFDAFFTAPVNGYATSQEYYQKASCLQLLNRISLPTLLISACDDPFLSQSCFPYNIAEDSKDLFLETPAKGGHVAFPVNGTRSWIESRIESFFENY